MSTGMNPKSPAGPPMTLGKTCAIWGCTTSSVAASGEENDLSMSRHETHEWKTLDAMAPAFTCTRCWIDGGDPHGQQALSRGPHASVQ